MQPSDLKMETGNRFFTGAPEGLDGLILADIARANPGASILHVARDEHRMAAMAEALSFFAPDVELIEFPAWDCLPYDRVSPAPGIMARRLTALADLMGRGGAEQPLIILTTVNAALQKVPPREVITKSGFSAKPGQSVSMDDLQAHLQHNGFTRTGTVVDRGDYAVRGGIIDIYPSGTENPVRLDFFGDTLESIRQFDVETQRTIKQLKSLDLNPANEVILNDETIGQFRTAYKALFGGDASQDPLYEAISSARRYQGMEHWMPLFYGEMATLLDYTGKTVIVFDHLSKEAIVSRNEQLADYFKARKNTDKEGTFGSAPYNPLEINQLYLDDQNWSGQIANYPQANLSPFEAPDQSGQKIVHAGGKQGRSFAAERARRDSNIYELVAKHLTQLHQSGKRVLVAAWSEGARDRLETILKDHGVSPIASAGDWAQASGRDREIISTVVLGIESGFETDDLAVVAEQDILGDRMVRRTRKTRRAADFIAELSSLEAGDLVVHVDHGIGKFEGLKTIDVAGAPRDCLHLTYLGGDRLFLPVENIELLSRYGAEDAAVRLDKLGGGAWQARKAKLKKRVRDIAASLIKTAAARELRKGAIFPTPEGLYDEFAARFPFTETEDQLDAINAVLEDFQKGKPMDRLVCGDVGFGKTEVAMRTAFVAVMAGKQVTIVVPTTLLARQHYASITERFEGLPVQIRQMSRLVVRKDIATTKKGLADGTIDIVVGTHALLAKDMKFRDLGLLIIDEEQHFGVKHKEQLKELRADVHVLTLTATPIPRTLQLAMTGVRELSLITTPPVDRLPVRTFISPFDAVMVRETLLRELYRGGQSFYVVPRVADIGEISEFLRLQVPELKVAIAHGQMSPGELEDVMNGFYDRQYDVLLATTIIESGIDIPTANTLVVHRSNMFGLAQLYQLRGRVGRSKQRAYALFTVPPRRVLTQTAEKRLKVLQSLDTLGAGFSLASHDLDIRGAGNLVGEEQSGHIKEVGFELYQAMLEEAVSSLRDNGGGDQEGEETWSPQINIGTSVLIPDSYVEDLQIRLSLYRRLSDLHEQEEIDAFAAEIHDRFGPPPEEVNHLLEIMAIKELCRKANVETIDAGAKGAVIGLRDGKFNNPQGLLDWMTKQGSFAKMRPDMKLVVRRSWDTPEIRLKGARQLMAVLADLAGQA
ncbi:Transcription-repair coupling factor [hydrothermal vent metagenome]|uniref:Transcription-repair coupling factor n=1 Tax=hydrothermal vent metagenome TaxID=652676 RepID=A0A3B0S783_9ZZZZ